MSPSHSDETSFGSACRLILGAARADSCAVTHPSGTTHWSRRRDRVSEFATVMKASKMSYHFLLASWGTLGNLSPLLTAGRRLRRNGHHVRVMADPAMRAEIEAAEFEFVTWRRAPIGEAADPADFSDMQDWIRRAMFVPAAAYAADIQDEIGRMPTDAVLSLDILFGAALGAEASDVPFAFLSPHVSIRTLPGMPPATSGLGQPRTPQERAEVDAASAGLAGGDECVSSHSQPGSCRSPPSHARRCHASVRSGRPASARNQSGV